MPVTQKIANNLNFYHNHMQLSRQWKYIHRRLARSMSRAKKFGTNSTKKRWKWQRVAKLSCDAIKQFPTNCHPIFLARTRRWSSSPLVPEPPRHSCQDASASSSAPSFDEHSQADNGKRSAFDVSWLWAALRCELYLVALSWPTFLYRIAKFATK